MQRAYRVRHIACLLFHPVSGVDFMSDLNHRYVCARALQFVRITLTLTRDDLTLRHSKSVGSLSPLEKENALPETAQGG